MMIEAICLGNWDSDKDRAAPVWLSPGTSYPVLQIIVGPGNETLIRIPSGESSTPGLWPASYFEFDSSSEDWTAQTDDRQLSLSPRELADIDWFTFLDDPYNESRVRVAKYIGGS